MNGWHSHTGRDADEGLGIVGGDHNRRISERRRLADHWHRYRWGHGCLESIHGQRVGLRSDVLLTGAISNFGLSANLVRSVNRPRSKV
jgi:hypothetical protein